MLAAFATSLQLDRDFVNLAGELVAAFRVVLRDRRFVVGADIDPLVAGVGEGHRAADFGLGRFFVVDAELARAAAAWLRAVGCEGVAERVLAGGERLLGRDREVFEAASSPVELMVRPRILSMQMTTNGTFQMSFAGVPNRSYAVERSTNTVNWSVAATMSSVSGQHQFNEAGAITNVSRIYRLRQTP